MIKFSWKDINNKFSWNAYSVLSYFYLMQGLKINPALVGKPSELVKKAIVHPYPSGYSFLVNPDEVLINGGSPYNIYNYIELASKRSLFDYSVRGITYLPMPLVPEYQRGIITVNPLLTITDNKVYFKYEQE